MSLSILPYVGSKRTDIKFFEDYIPKNIKITVEPFGGSGYLSLYLFSLNNNLKCVVNDVDEDLINFFIEIKKDSNKIIDGYNLLIEPKPTKEQFNEIIKKYKSGKVDNTEKAILYLFYNKFYSIRKGLYPLNSINMIEKEKYTIFFNWLKNTEFTKQDYTLVIEKYRNQKDAFVFLDPPYFDSFNSYYSSYISNVKNKQGKDNTVMYIDIRQILAKCKCKVLFIINKNAITEYIYSKFIKGEYNKIYQITKKQAQHLIIANY